MNRSLWPWIAAAGVLLLIIGIGVGVLAARMLAPHDEHAGHTAAAPVEAERRVLYWYDPMVPDQHFDRPGKSPFMDMMLVPRYADEEGAAPGVRIDPVLRQNLGVRTAPVERGRLETRLRLPGTLAWDQGAERRVSARSDAIVERLHVNVPFANVQRGQVLATLLAPEWSAALAEHHALAAAQSQAARDLATAARARLLALGMSAEDIAAPPPTDGVPRIRMRAPIDAVVTEIDVREGERVGSGQLLFRLNPRDRLWLLADVPQWQAARVQPGDAVEVVVPGLADARFDAHVDALLPDLDPATRAQRLRIVLEDADARLAAGMYAEAEVRGQPTAERILLPSEAVIETGATPRVIVVRDQDRFEPVEVRLGSRGGGRVEVLEGLRGDERVVVSGQFMIDSEASLRGVLRRLGDPEHEDAHAHHGHGEHADHADSGARRDREQHQHDHHQRPHHHDRHEHHQHENHQHEHHQHDHRHRDHRHHEAERQDRARPSRSEHDHHSTSVTPGIRPRVTEDPFRTQRSEALPFKGRVWVGKVLARNSGYDPQQRPEQHHPHPGPPLEGEGEQRRGPAHVRTNGDRGHAS